MKNLLNAYEIAIALFALLVVILMIAAARGKSEYRRHFLRTMTLTLITFVAYLVFLQAPVLTVARISMTVYLATTQWVAYGVGLFSLRYAGYQKKLTWIRRVTHILLLLNLLLLVVNYRTGWVFTVEAQILKGMCFWVLLPGPLYLVENLISAILAALVMVPLVVKAAQVPMLYKWRYLGMAVAFAVVVVVNVIGHLSSNPVEVSILLYAMYGGFASYNVVYADPQRVTMKLFRMANSRISDALIYYDMSGRTVFYNDKAAEMFPAQDDKTRKALMKDFRDNRVMTDRTNPGYAEQWEESFIISGQEHFCDVEYRVVTQENHHIGFYIRFLDKTEEMRIYEQQHYRATHDTLTDLYNRERFFAEVDKRKEERPGKQWIMVVSNIRDFKLINELFGEEMGDAVLLKQAELLRKYSHPTTLYGRVADDKFGLFMDRDYFSPDLLVECINGMKRLTENNSYQMHVQAGVYEVEDIHEPAAIMYDKAVLAMKSIASEYRKMFGYYDASLMNLAIRNKQTADYFNQAMEAHEFHLYLVPQLDEEGNIGGADAVPYLLSDEGNLDEEALDSILESSGSIYKLDRFIWEEAIRVQAEWQKRGKQLVTGIHLRAKDIYYMDVYAELTGLVTQYQVNPRCLLVAIAEDVLMLAPKENMNLMGMLQGYGFRVAIEDFGNGYSSLNMLKDMTPDAIRIGEIFLQLGGNRSRGEMILKAIIRMAKRLGIRTLADGITEEEQFEILKKYGNQIYSGPYFYKAMPVEEFERICFHE